MNPAPTLEEAYVQHYTMVKRLCMRILRDIDDAEDAAQDVFLHLATRLHHFRGESKFATWLTRVTVNLTLMKLRRKKTRRDSKSIEEFPLDDVVLLTTDRELNFTVERLTLKEILEELRPKHRAAIELAAQGFGPNEVAVLLGVSVATAKSRVCVARKLVAVEFLERKRKGVTSVAPLEAQ